jgi:hypothetical protein
MLALSGMLQLNTGAQCRKESVMKTENNGGVTKARWRKRMA